MKVKFYPFVFFLAFAVLLTLNADKTKADNPNIYEIDNCADFANLNNIGSSSDTYLLTADFNCSETTIAPINWDGVGFSGTLDGQGHSISNFNLNYPEVDSIALFTELISGAIVKNIDFISGEITGSNDVSLLGGAGTEEVTISGINSYVIISGNDYVGGLVAEYGGENAALSIKNSMIYGAISGNSYVGGLVGYLDTTFNNSYTVSIAHNGVNAPIYSTSEGGIGDNIGGLIGYAYMSFAEGASLINGVFNVYDNAIYADSSISGDNNIGGLIGYLTAENSSETNELTINLGPNNSVNPEVSGITMIGGLVGIIDVIDNGALTGGIDIFQSHTSSDVTSTSASAGGLVGEMYFAVQTDNGFTVDLYDNFNYSSVSGINSAGGLIGYITDNNKNYPILRIDRNYSAGAIESLGYAGGLIGVWDTVGEINDSFVVSPVATTSLVASVVVADLGAEPANLTLNNVYFDQYINGDMPTVELDSPTGATAVNIGNSDPDYFKNNTISQPFAEEDGTPIWDFISVWYQDINGYPTLQEFSYNLSVVYVDDDYTESSSGGHIWGVEAYDNLYDAIGAVGVDGTIYIASGDYASSEQMILEKQGVTLMGPGLRDDTAQRATLSFADSGYMIVAADEVTINGLYLEVAEDAAIEYILSLLQVSNVVIENNLISGGAVGLVIMNPSQHTLDLSTTIRNNIISNNAMGLLIAGKGTHLVTGNTFQSNTQFGILTGYMMGADLSGSVISGNEIVDNFGGLAIMTTTADDLPFTVGPNNDIHDNSVGVMIYGDINKLSISNNKIYSNTRPFGEMGMPGAVPAGLLITDHRGILDATLNWWGNETGPTVTSNPNGTGDIVLAADQMTTSGPIFYRPFYVDEDFSTLSTLNTELDDLSNYFNVGSLLIPQNEDFEDASVIELAEDVVISVSDNGGTSSITLPLGTNITRDDSENINTLELSIGAMATSTLQSLPADELIHGSLQWGLEGASLNFSEPITVSIYVGSSLNSKTLNVHRSRDGSGSWTNDGIVGPATCLVSDGNCVFEATKASVYAVTKLPDTDTGNEDEESIQNGGGNSALIVMPRAIQLSDLYETPLSFSINNNASSTTSAQVSITMNADTRTVDGYAISLSQDFKDASIIPYTDEATYTLPSSDGEYRIYLKYYSITGHTSELLSQSIILRANNQNESPISVIEREKRLSKSISRALSQRLSGRILLQVEEQGEAWYIEPRSQKRYYMGRPDDALALMRYFGLGINNGNLDKFLKTSAPAKFAGRIFLAVERNGEAYYVNPVDLRLHYLGRPADAYAVMRTLGLGISNDNIRQIEVAEIE